MAAERLLPVAEPETATLSLPDGVGLVADLWRPAGPGRHPVLLMRQPYGRAIASTLTLAHPAWYAARGYIVVVQDVRGRGGSGGAFRLFEHEATDGAATLAWAADLPGSDGRVATYGFSYQAVTQFLALAGARRAGTKRPDAIVPAMGGWDIRDDWAFTGGAFALAGNIGWACQMGAEVARLRGDATAFARLAEAARGAPWSGPVAARPEVLARHAADHHYADWLGDDPAYWDRIAPARLLAGADLAVPGLHVGGWQDFLLDGTLGAYDAFRAGPAPQRLLVGPWTHAPWGRRVGSLDLGPEALTPVDCATVAFLDHVLLGRAEAGPPVRLFDIGVRGWIGFPAWPEPEPRAFYLASDGRAATAASGRLAPGYQDRAALDDRSDVAVYDGPALAMSLRLAGRVAAEIFVETPAVSHDLHATLSLIEPDGRGITLTAGHLRVFDAAAPGLRRIAMRAVCCTLRPGQRLRLSLQAAAWPAFAVNPGGGGSPEAATAMQAQVVVLTLRHGTECPSRLLLPILD